MRLPRWLRRALAVAGVLAFLLATGAAALFAWHRTQLLDSGGPLRPRQAAVDVRRYDLALRLDPARREIAGRNRATLAIVAPLDAVELHLDGRLTVRSAHVDGAPARFVHRRGLITVPLERPFAPGERHVVEIVYGGRPKVAAFPPWLDGMVWRTTPSGAPWIGVTTQGDGADDWWPCKDHPSDEPDEGLSIELTVPSPLVGLASGRRVGATENPDGTTTTRWEVSYPINNYAVSVNVGPYVPIEATYRGIDGAAERTIVFWAIPEHADEARRLWTAQGARLLEVLGRRFGEYPFWKDKYWVAESPYLGMEHQSLVAYGARFEDNDDGFDELLLHETAHEWWGNKITARDWADFWIHEGFGTYAEALFVLDTAGEEKYLAYMRRLARRTRNRTPIVRGPDALAKDAYIGDIYAKGACVLHTLKWLVGDEAFFTVLRRFVDADRPEACRLVATDELERLVAEVAGRPAPWFWERYLRRAELPRWTLSRVPVDAEETAERTAAEGTAVTAERTADATDEITLSWDDPAFELPLPVTVGGVARRIDMPSGRAAFRVPAGAAVEVDPRGLVLAAGELPRAAGDAR